MPTVKQRPARRNGHAAKAIRRKNGALGASNSFYDGADTSGPTRTPIQLHRWDASSSLTRYNRQILADVGWALYANLGFIKGTIDEMARIAVGNGIYPWSIIKDKDTARAYDTWFNQFWTIGILNQRYDLCTFQKLGSKAIDVAGDYGVLLTESTNGYPQIQPWEAHRIASPSESGIFQVNEFFDGVKVNEDGRSVAFSIQTGPQYDPTYSIVPASSFVHVAEPERISGIRGASGLKHAISNLRDIKDILAFEKLGVKSNSAIAMVVTMANLGQQIPGSLLGGSDGTVVDATGKPVTFEVFQSGAAIPKLATGEKLEAHTSDRPSVTFSGFIEDLRRDVAAGLGIPLECVWDSSQLGGTTQRFVLKRFESRCSERQACLKAMTYRIRTWAIAKAIKRGDLPFDEDWWRVRWQMPAPITVDVGRDQKANLSDYVSGLRTIQEDYAERNIYWEDGRNQLQEGAEDLLRRAQMLRKLEPELTLQMALDLIEKRSQGSSPSMPAAQQETSPPQQQGGKSQ